MDLKTISCQVIHFFFFFKKNNLYTYSHTEFESSDAIFTKNYLNVSGFSINKIWASILYIIVFMLLTKLVSLGF